MKNIEVHNRINQIVKVFNGFGMWRNEDDFTIFRKAAWKLFYLIFFASFPILLILGGLVSDTKDESIFLISVGIVVSVNTVKLSYILWKKKEIQAFLHDIGYHIVADYKEFLKVDKTVNNLMNFSSIFCFMLFFNFICLSTICLPVFSNEKRLPFSVWFPFDWKNSEASYWLAYVYVVSALMIGGISMLINIVTWYLMINCSIKYQILENQFRNMFPAKSTIKKMEISKEEENLFVRKFVDLIQTHRNTQTTIYKFKSCFSTLFFAQITTSGICICCSVYALAFSSRNESLIQYMIYASVALYNVFDIFMIMYFGNEITLASDRLSYCLFESNWQNRLSCRKSCKKTMIILTEILKQPQELVVGKVYPLNMTTFTSIVKFAYSTFNILKNMT